MALLKKRSQKLEQICQRLDEASTRTIAHKDFFSNAATSQVDITSLFAGQTGALCDSHQLHH